MVSIVSVCERGEQQTASWSKDSREYQRHFQVNLSGISFDLTAICTASGFDTQGVPCAIPAYCAVYPYDSFCFCNSLRARCADGNGVCWEVVAGYSNQGASEPNPLDRPPVLTWDFEEFEEIIDQTEDDTPKAIVNSANDSFDPPLTRTKGLLILRYQVNLEGYDPSIAQDYAFTVNSGSFFGWDEGTVLCLPPKGQEVVEQDSTYWSVEFAFKFNPQKWNRKILDQGFRTLQGGKQQNITVSGQPVSSPVLLDGHGAKLTSGADPVFLDFVVFEENDFSALGIEGS